MSLTLRGGNLVVDSAGSVLECSTCPCGPGYSTCLYCTTTPEELEVQISGLTTGGGCNDCSTLNGTYVVTAVSSLGCVWYYNLPTTVCNLDRVAASVAQPINFTELSVNFQDAGSAEITWTHSFGSTNAVDCNFVNQDCAFVAASICNGTSTLCRVNGL
jgi:hypothetical protein